MTEMNENSNSKNVFSGTSIPSNNMGENYDIYLQYEENLWNYKVTTAAYIKLNGFWIETTGEYDSTDNDFTIGPKSIIANGTYIAADDLLYGYSQVEVNVNNVDGNTIAF